MFSKDFEDLVTSKEKVYNPSLFIEKVENLDDLISY
jgi:hypothetical protein